jgi:hypothetical protein
MHGPSAANRRKRPYSPERHRHADQDWQAGLYERTIGARKHEWHYWEDAWTEDRQDAPEICEQR